MRCLQLYHYSNLLGISFKIFSSKKNIEIMEVKNELKRRTALNIHSKTISNILITSNWVNEKILFFCGIAVLRK